MSVDVTPDAVNMEGGCTCRQVRYRLIGKPLIVHACHCRWCQRETGTAHALNALYEADRVVHIAGEPEIVVTPSASGSGQKIARCPSCRVAVWSNYPQAGPAVRFVRVGTIGLHSSRWLSNRAGRSSGQVRISRCDAPRPRSVSTLDAFAGTSTSPALQPIDAVRYSPPNIRVMID
jgi:hypothetical protein